MEKKEGKQLAALFNIGEEKEGRQESPRARECLEQQDESYFYGTRKRRGEKKRGEGICIRNREGIESRGEGKEERGGGRFFFSERGGGKEGGGATSLPLSRKKERLGT